PVTGAESLTAFESIGAVVQLTPAGIVNVESPDVPGLERLVAEVKANRSEVVAELKRHAVPVHPCVSCHAETDPEDLFCPPCWERRLARMPLDVAERRRRLDHARRSTIARAARSATSPARGIRPETSPERSPS
ncbi:MAG TPA: hypothetical protein VF316_04495, partial [Polyangiaceae bacterium]